METSPAVTVVLLLGQSHIILFSLPVCMLMCVYVCFEAVCSLAVTGNDLISPLVTGGTQRELRTDNTHTHSERERWGAEIGIVMVL